MTEYYYLVSSLPVLEQDGQLKLTLEQFYEQCAEWLTEEELNILHKLGLVPTEDADFKAGSAAELWYRWEISLRNEIAARRAGRGRDISTMTLYEKDYFSEIERGVQAAYSAPNPLEREAIFDHLRFQYLNDLESAHQFDFERLCIYKIKLLLLLKVKDRDIEAGYSVLEDIAAKIAKNKAAAVEEK